MPTIPGTIDLGKFRVVYEEEREQGSGDSDGYLLQQRAIIRLNEELVKLAQQEDYAVYCDVGIPAALNLARTAAR